jgi:hypothetical protein
MVCIYNLNTSHNKFNHSFRHTFPKAKLRIPLPHALAGIVNPTNTKIKQVRFFREVYIILGIEPLILNVLWIINKQLIAQSRL